ncbi:MAG: hypothetical protein QOD11_3073 [Bradyrhizobium sp.]|nr:hypothetical protein [Bradyrhizobium sp.]
MRVVAFIVLALGLGSCADPYVSTTANTVSSGEWKIERQADRITGNAIASALLRTRNSSHSGEAYAQPAQLQLTCFERNPVVRFSFEFKIGSDKNSALGYRFDDKPGHDNVESRILIGYTVIVIEDKAAVAQFIDELINSNTLYLRIRSLNSGRTTAEFRVAGAPAAVQAALAECPVAATQKRTS